MNVLKSKDRIMLVELRSPEIAQDVVLKHFNERPFTVEDNMIVDRYRDVSLVSLDLNGKSLHKLTGVTYDGDKLIDYEVTDVDESELLQLIDDERKDLAARAEVMKEMQEEYDKFKVFSEPTNEFIEHVVSQIEDNIK